MINLISPKEVEKERVLIKELKTFGLDYFDKDSTLGWNYVLDHVWLYKNIKNYLKVRKLSNPIIFDVGCGNSKFHNFIEFKLKINVIGIDRPIGFCHQEELKNTDYNEEFLEFKKYSPNSIDIIYWLSAIEHNKFTDIKKLYEKSIEFLKSGGLLLITFPISKKTYWFEESQQSNLSIEDAKQIFSEDKMLGTFDKIKDEFKENILSLRDRYKKRYNHFNNNDPEFVVGGLKQIKL